MQTINITERNLKKLPLLQISNQVYNTEGRLYIYEHKNNWKNARDVLKIYFSQDEQSIADKMYVISQLLANKEYIDMPELVLPNALAVVGGNIQGFSMPLIENNVNMQLLLNNPNVRLKAKLNYLKQIITILKKVEDIKELSGKFFLGDIYEGNFIWDVDTQKVKAVDLDSSYIKDSKVSVSKFLTFNQYLENNPEKYPIDKESYRVIPNRETSIASFWYMFLNVISGDQAYLWSMNEYYNYLSFLTNQGIDKNIVEELSNMYTAAKFSDLDKKLLDTVNCSKDYSIKRARIPDSRGSYYK